jgi:3',5'-cyclic AMP phosphodiesterase CpdA
MNTSIAHISDTHFGTEVAEVVAALRETLITLNPDILILSGDITQRAHVQQFKAASDFVESLPIKTKLAVPGNHDIPLFNLFERFLTPYKHYQNAFGARETTWHNEDLGIVCYDATHPMRHKMGKLEPKALLRGIEELKKTMPKDAVILACAHQPLVTSWEEDKRETLINREETAKLWAEAGVDIVMSGHVHVPILTTTRKRFPELSRHFVLAGAGTAVSHRVRSGAPNSFNMLNIANENAAKSVQISQYEFVAGNPMFSKAKHIRFHSVNGSWEKI